MMNKQKGNMYYFVTHTWNPIKGRCSYQCSYCFYQSNPRFKNNIGKLRLDERSLKDNLGKDNFIFVGSSVDMFAEDVPKEWIIKVLEHCKKFNNTYLFQTKNPKRFEEFIINFQEICVNGDVVLGTTIETNRETPSKAPSTLKRIDALTYFPDWRIMITLEPILDFDLDNLVSMIKRVTPEWVNIGADSKGHNLPEPSREKLNSLIKESRKFTKVKLKSNLNRLLKRK